MGSETVISGVRLLVGCVALPSPESPSGWRLLGGSGLQGLRVRDECLRDGDVGLLDLLRLPRA
jgi:hypothetical protein